MTKREKYIKRVYEEGRETIFKSARKKPSASPKRKQPRRRKVVRKKAPRTVLKKRLSLPPAIALDIEKLSKPKPRIPDIPRIVEKQRLPQTKAGKQGSAIFRKMSLSHPHRHVIKHAAPARPSFTKHTAPARPSFAQLAADSKELPQRYDRTFLNIMLKDPYCIYAYWEIAEKDVEEVRKKNPGRDQGSARRILRVYDVSLIDFNGFNANGFFDIEIGAFSSNWYINLWCDNISYLGEIGLLFSDGCFAPLARSGAVHVPLAGYSPRAEQIWMKVTDEAFHKPYVEAVTEPAAPARRHKTKAGGRGGYAGTDEQAISSGEETYVSYKTTSAGKAEKRTVRRRRIYLTDEDIRRYYSRLNPALKEVLMPRIYKYPTKASTASRDNLAYGLSLDEATRQRLFSFLPDDTFVKRILKIGASESLVLLESGEALLSSASAAGQAGASESIVSARAKQRSFFFELNAELIVYGRTEPDAEVRLGTRYIKLRPDGTFSLRFALPDGKIPLEFTAASNDKIEKRSINTYVSRNTDYASEIKEEKDV